MGKKGDAEGGRGEGEGWPWGQKGNGSRLRVQREQEVMEKSSLVKDKEQAERGQDGRGPARKRGQVPLGNGSQGFLGAWPFP